MKIHSTFVIIVMIITVLLTFAISKSMAAETNKKRWGITTKEPVENKTENQKPSNEKKKTENTTEQIKPEPAQPNDDEAKKSAQKDESDGSPLEKDKKPSAKETQSNKTGQQKKADIKNEDSLKIQWKNKKQKATCETHLGQLKERFLKARYYSIQGVPCGTAENARSFMETVDNCKRDCPEGFLKKHGYTTRIIRNLSWLEKLGTERCPDMNLPRKAADGQKELGN